ncbi:MAG: hypothetical protein LBC03_03785 [Nitrososphaerota archaeon]|nr:hypothetical protein [Nitrososphaerota archaeon]
MSGKTLADSDNVMDVGIQYEHRINHFKLKNSNKETNTGDKEMKDEETT